MSEILAIRGGTLLDGNGGPPLKDPVILVRKSRITQVGTAREVTIPEGARVLDMGQCVLMPGMMDIHAHLAAPNVWFYRNTDVARLTRSSAEILLHAARHAEMLLEAGFTTVRDLDLVTPQGLAHESLVYLRDAIASGVARGPRLLVAGMTFITGSHFEIVGWLKSMPRVPGYCADGPWEFRKLVRRSIREGVDLLKTCISGGTSTFHSEEARSRNITRDELDALVDEAHAWGKPVAAHCHTPESIAIAVAAGVDTIEHCVYVDDDAIEKVVDARKYVVPTLAFRQKRVIDSRRERGFPDFIIERMEEYLTASTESFRRYHRAGARFAMGTDTHVDPPFGENAYELEVYVALGLSPMEAIQTATRNAADAIGRAKDLGTIETGKIADILAVHGDPLGDIRILQQRERIRLVMKDGKVFVDRGAAAA